jgi:quercetin dioxygenase-like cupin family protein
MPIEIRRFGVGNRRPDGPPGTSGVTGQVVHSDARGVVSELAFTRAARIEPHANPNTTWFVVIEGGGWVQVGDERARVAAGEAVLWPADVPHAAWTELSEMRAIVVEYAGADDAYLRGVVDGRTLAIGAGAGAEAEAGSGGAEGAGLAAAQADGELSASPADAARSAIEGEPV